MLWTILQTTLILLFPAISLYLDAKTNLGKWLSPFVLCILLGVLVNNFGLFPVDGPLATTFMEMTILFAIPLLLYSTNLMSWIRHAKTALLSYCLCLIAGLIATTSVALLYPKGLIEDSWILSGMLVGIYSGGTPNMQAIGLALNAEETTIIMVNAADLFCGGLYLIFLTSIAQRFLGLFLPPFAATDEHMKQVQAEEKQEWLWKDSLKAIGLTVLIIGSSVGAAYLIYGDQFSQHVSFLILMLTSLSIGASFVRPIRTLRGSFETGEYFLLMFCVALGLLANFQQLIQEGGQIMLFCIAAFVLTVILHFLLARLFKIDRDTVMITSTAALFGPAFIGQIASVIGNKKLIVSGIALGLLGYAIGNYLGISLAYGLKYFMGQ